MYFLFVMMLCVSCVCLYLAFVPRRLCLSYPFLSFHFVRCFYVIGTSGTVACVGLPPPVTRRAPAQKGALVDALGYVVAWRGGGGGGCEWGHAMEGRSADVAAFLFVAYLKTG